MVSCIYTWFFLILAIVCRGQIFGHSFTKNLAMSLPKNWSLIYQKFGHEFTKKLVIDLPKIWP